MAESGMYVYVSQQDARQISVYRMSLSGELSKVQDVSVTGKAMPMAVSPDRRFLFIALRTEPYSIASFAIDGANGTLTHLGNAPAPNSAPYISTDRTGRFLLGAYNPESEPAGRRTGWISVSAIGPHGHVQPPHQVIRTPPKTHSILPDPSNRFAFVASCDGDAIVRYAFDAATGLLNPDPLPPLDASATTVSEASPPAPLPSELEPVTPETTATPAQEPGHGEPFLAKRGSRIFHRRECTWVARIPEIDRVYFKRVTEAREQGFGTCPSCEPWEPD